MGKQSKIFLLLKLYCSWSIWIITLFILVLYIIYWLIYYLAISETLTNEVKRTIKRKENVLVVFSVSPSNCTMPIGESIYEQSYLNKRQYAQLRGYDIIYNRRQPDPKVTGNYNKVSILREILRNESSLEVEKRHEWVIWMDYDTLVNDMSHVIDFERFEGRDMVIWGNWFAINILVDGVHGVNGGVMYLRNTEWSAQFLDLVLDFGRDQGRAREEEMRARMYNYVSSLYEQNAITYLLKSMPELQKKVYLEYVHKINWFWDLFGTRYRLVPFFRPFIVHFAGCQFCWHEPKPGCLDIWKKYYSEANRAYSHQLAKLKLHRDVQQIT